MGAKQQIDSRFSVLTVMIGIGLAPAVNTDNFLAAAASQKLTLGTVCEDFAFLELSYLAN